MDDSAGNMQELSDFGVSAINDGYAMSWESKGGGSSAAGFFGQNIALGPEVGDEVKVHFDFRIWRDAPNVNGGIIFGDNDPEFGIINFGLYQDTDKQIGMTNPFAGRQLTDEDTGALIGERSPAVWGAEEGRFDGGLAEFGEGDDIGTRGDNGWLASVTMGDANNGQDMRIQEEVNSDRIFQGSDRHDIVENEGIDHDNDPFTNPIFDGFDLDLEPVWNFELSLTRATDVDPGDTVFAALNMTNKETGEVFTMSGLESVEDEETGGAQSDSWDYFAITNRSSGRGETDFILDNFTVEVLGSNASVAGDCNGDGILNGEDLACVTTIADRDFVLGELNTLPGDLDGDGDVGFPDFLVLSANFGNGGANYAQGNIDLVDTIGFPDFLILSANFGKSPAAAAAVPEPTGFALVAIAGLFVAGSRRRRN